jgi:CheY-like chemotaxis protein
LPSVPRSAATSALALLEKVRPKVAVLDFHLSGVTGVELAARIHERLPDVPIILMSGGVGTLDQQMLERIGVKIFVNKPVPMAALHRAVVQLIR